jgi:hypothetical protein
MCILVVLAQRQAAKRTLDAPGRQRRRQAEFTALRSMG